MRTTNKNLSLKKLNVSKLKNPKAIMGGNGGGDGTETRTETKVCVGTIRAKVLS